MGPSLPMIQAIIWGFPSIPFRPLYYVFRPSCVVGKSLHCNFALLTSFTIPLVLTSPLLSSWNNNRLLNSAALLLHARILAAYLCPSPLHWRRIVGQGSCTNLRRWTLASYLLFASIWANQVLWMYPWQSTYFSSAFVLDIVFMPQISSITYYRSAQFIKKK